MLSEHANHNDKARTKADRDGSCHGDRSSHAYGIESKELLVSRVEAAGASGTVI